ncbi:hypothetical protein GY45DRAFT_112439 [Cubamyces sp. BRFM 1775]|nr:hypothetical protein GY45DRAFT_112439 [Cubamyces sp. BRFM 1775]
MRVGRVRERMGAGQKWDPNGREREGGTLAAADNQGEVKHKRVRDIVAALAQSLCSRPAAAAAVTSQSKSWSSALSGSSSQSASVTVDRLGQGKGPLDPDQPAHCHFCPTPRAAENNIAWITPRYSYGYLFPIHAASSRALYKAPALTGRPRPSICNSHLSASVSVSPSSANLFWPGSTSSIQ